MTSEQNKLSDERLAELMKFSESDIIVAISEIEVQSALIELISRRASAGGELHGPFGWLNGCRGLSEDSWTLECDPLENNDEYFAIPLYAKQDPFKEVGLAPAPPPAPVVEGKFAATIQRLIGRGNALLGYCETPEAIEAGAGAAYAAWKREADAGIELALSALHSKALPDVSEAMVERAQAAYRAAGEKRNWHHSWPDAEAMREILTAALNAAQGGK